MQLVPTKGKMLTIDNDFVADWFKQITIALIGLPLLHAVFDAVRSLMKIKRNLTLEKENRKSFRQILHL